MQKTEDKEHQIEFLTSVPASLSLKGFYIFSTTPSTSCLVYAAETGKNLIVWSHIETPFTVGSKMNPGRMLCYSVNNNRQENDYQTLGSEFEWQQVIGDLEDHLKRLPMHNS